jgi:dolichol-phosphate mannosyltransferase
MKLIVITPTYNEKSNIEKHIRDVEEVMRKNQIEGGMIIVDDNSPDGTAKIVEDLMPKINDEKFAVSILKREGKLGLGSAYIAGFKKALGMKADYILEMDADFSHDPKYIPQFIKELENGNDIVVGSRYIRGGGVKNWSPVRIAISRFGSIYSKMILWWNIKDATSGFVCYSQKALETIALDKVKSNGYSFQIEMKYRAHQAKLKLKEIPIMFSDRVNGVSKMSSKIVREAITKVIYLRLSK